MKRFVLFVMLMMSVAVASAQKWSLTPEIGMMAVKRGGPSYNYEPGQSWNARWKIGVGVEYVVKPDRFCIILNGDIRTISFRMGIFTQCRKNSRKSFSAKSTRS